MDKCFVIMPISTPESHLQKYNGDKDHFRHVLDHLICPAIEKVGLQPLPPITKGSDVIHGEVIKNLETAEVVLCDMSSLNPNVFFELGIRTALNKSICLIKDDVTINIPFDTTIINHHTYLSALNPWTLQKDILELSEHIKNSIEKSTGSSSLWKYFSLSMRGEPIKEKTGVEGKLELLTMQMDGLKQQIENFVPRIDVRPKQRTNDELLDEFINIGHKYGAEPRSANLSEPIQITFKKGTLSDDARKSIMRRARELGTKVILSEL